MAPRFAILCCSTAFLPAELHGGLPYSTFHLSKALIRAGADVRVVTTDRNGTDRLTVPTDCWTTHDGVPVWYTRTSPGPYLFGASTSKVIRETMPRVDCVINSGTLWVHSGRVAWREAKRFHKPSVSYVRGLLHARAFGSKPLRKQIYWRLVGKRILSDSAAIVALNVEERQAIRACHVTGRIEVIPNGATFDEDGGPVSVDRAELEAAYPALAGRRYVLFLGRIHAIKGMDILLPAIAEILGRKECSAFVIAGPIDPAYAARWTKLVRASGLEGRLILPGAVRGPEKIAWLKNADLFVLTSHSEGLSMAALEALRAGCPLVVTRSCNLPEVQDAGAGLVTEPDVHEVARAIESLLADDDARLAMARRARELARSRFDWNAIGERTLALCREVAMGRSVQT